MQSLWVIAATFLFAIMAACVKLAGDDYTSSEILLCRGVFGVLFVLSLIRLYGGSIRTKYFKEHIMRSIYGVGSLWIFFYTLNALPLAMATTLNYMSPIWIACILFFAGWKKGNTQLDKTFLLTIGCSFIGVVMLLKPAMHSDQLWVALLALISGIMTALAYIQIRQLSLLGEPEYRVVFYFSLIGAITGLIASLVTGHIPFMHEQNARGITLILAIGVTATLAQMTLTRAYRLGNTFLTANLQYSNILFTSILNIVIWHNSLDWIGWCGVGIILLCGIAATFHQHKTAKAAKH